MIIGSKQVRNGLQRRTRSTTISNKEEKKEQMHKGKQSKAKEEVVTHNYHLINSLIIS